MCFRGVLRVRSLGPASAHSLADMLRGYVSHRCICSQFICLVRLQNRLVGLCFSLFTFGGIMTSDVTDFVVEYIFMVCKM